ncbi:site-specific integrase [Ferrovum sp.]|uniref:tyrosine-type recombinase/integrase n=1 Tax=Ferrovum sp. TaxID=2609467 RepID=UPI0026272F0D|nr:site-specific integrase [Ferrovum sp.]
MPIRKDAVGRWHVELCINRKRVHRRLPEGSSAGDAKRIESELFGALSRKKTDSLIPSDPLINDLLAYYTGIHAKRLRSPESARHHAIRIAPWCEGKTASQSKQVAIKFIEDAIGSYAAATINRSLGTLKKCLSIAYDRGQTEINYGLQIKRLPENNARDNYMTVEQVQSIAQYCTEVVQAAIWIATLTGMRRGEIVKLKKEDIVNGTIIVRIGNTKTSKTRSVPVASPLRKWLEYVPLKITADGIGTSWERARVKAGLPDANFHDLRHTCASLLLKISGVTLYTVGEILGHSSTNTTKRYAHLADAQKREALEGLAEIYTENYTGEESSEVKIA